jgi:DNA-binding IclR family transcriptional regulator
MDHTSGVQLLDKVVAIFRVAGEGPQSLGDLTDLTGIPRPTAHRLAVAMEGHGLLVRDGLGRFGIGPTVLSLASGVKSDPLADAAAPVLRGLRDRTGESCQVYRRQGEQRVCIASADRLSGLRDSVPTGAQLPLTAGSAAQILLAWEPPDQVRDLLTNAAFGKGALESVRRRGWAASVAEREAGVASVSAPVRGEDGAVVAAISVSGPLERLGRAPGRTHAAAVVAAAAELTARLAGGEPNQ